MMLEAAANAVAVWPEGKLRLSLRSGRGFSIRRLSSWVTPCAAAIDSPACSAPFSSPFTSGAPTDQATRLPTATSPAVAQARSSPWAGAGSARAIGAAASASRLPHCRLVNMAAKIAQRRDASLRDPSTRFSKDPAPVILRPATLDDAEALAETGRAAFVAKFGDLYRPEDLAA